MFTQRRRLGIESLESRNLLAADLVNGTLTVLGTNANDNIQIQVATVGPHAGELQVDLNGAQSFFNVAQVNALVVHGLKGNDQITVNDNVTIAATIFGGTGNDTIKGGGGNDSIHGDSGNDTINGSLGADNIEGGIGNDSIHAGAGDDHVSGDAGNDSIWGDEDNDFLVGGNGNDTLDGEEGDDDCFGGNGKDALRGGDNNDALFGENGQDNLWGGEGDDFLDGGNSTDDCQGENGDDELKGGHGRDRVNGGGGSNLYDDDDQDDSSNGIPCDLDSRFDIILAGQNGAHGEGRFRNKNEGNQLEKEFRLEIANVAANSSFDIIVAGITLGQITTDGNGEGEIRYSDHPTGNEVMLPGNFPTLAEGTVVQIGNVLTGTCVNHFSLT